MGEGSGGSSEKLRRAREMRRTPTPPERVLWQALRANALNGLHFRRQVPIGRDIADFFCAEARLVIEVDGATHSDNARDRVRDAWLQSQQLRVLHVWNNEVMRNLPGVLTMIRNAATTPPPRPLPQGEGERSAASST